MALRLHGKGEGRPGDTGARPKSQRDDPRVRSSRSRRPTDAGPKARDVGPHGNGDWPYGSGQTSGRELSRRCAHCLLRGRRKGSRAEQSNRSGGQQKPLSDRDAKQRVGKGSKQHIAPTRINILTTKHPKPAAKAYEDPWTCLLAATILTDHGDSLTISLADLEYRLPKAEIAHPNDWKPGRSGHITIRTRLARELQLIK